MKTTPLNTGTTIDPDLTSALRALTAAGLAFSEVDTCAADQCPLCAGAAWVPLRHAA